MELNRCLGCMNPFRGYPCPACGYDPQKRRDAEYALPLGTILAGKYLVGRVLGQGGFGITYIGLDIALERKVAIKEYYPSGQANRTPGTSAVIWTGSEQARTELRNGMEMVLKEARKMVKVEEVPGVVKVRELFRENNTAYIVMDYVEGETLKDRLRKAGPMPWSQAKKIFLPVIRTMESVHQAGIIHRDLSPDNLMLAPGGAVKVLDLGAAKDITVNTGTSSMPVAKSGFSPLEQYGQQGGSGPYTDVYALAATLYYTLTGKAPLSALDRINKDQLNWDYPGLKAAPENVRQALRKALALRPEQRTRSMADFYAQLAAETPGKRKMPPKDVCVAAGFAAAALCLLLSITAALLVRRRTPSAPTVPESTAAPTIAVPRSTDGGIREIPTVPVSSETAETENEATAETSETEPTYAEPTSETSTEPEGPGSGTQEDPYRLYSAADLELVRTYSSAYFRLERDIDLGGAAFTPLGVFNGTLDGNGHTLSGLSYEFAEGMSEVEVAALFKNVGNEGVVKNLKISCTMDAGDLENTDAAGITIRNEGLIDHCTVIVQASNCHALGGITRNNTAYGSITYCTVTVTADNCKFVGGIAEYQSGSVADCSAYVQVTDVTSMGGIAYANKGSIQNCSADGSVQTSITIGILASLVGENIKGGTVFESTGSIINSATGKTLPAIGHQA